MKHLKTFESFNQSVDEGFFDDMVNKVKNITKPDVKPSVKKNLIDFVKKLDTNRFKFMQVMSKEKTKKEFSVDDYLKMAEDIDNYNGKVITKGDVVYYQPASFKGNDGGFGKSGNVAS
jgi:vacuolar-type H+-ATPase subunit E/Vma4